ncbi:phosphonate ABC transporter substrate-binding protein, partial [Klebsiella pneumoniae]
MSRFLKGVGLGMAGIVLLLCGLIALYYFESKAELRAD